MHLSAVILAGGESRRMGRDKAWVRVGGQPLIRLAFDKIRAVGIEEIYVSGRPGETYAGLKCPVLHDLEPGFGPLGGIERALNASTLPMVLVLAVDLPGMTPGFLQKLAAASDRLTGAVPKLRGEFEPLAAIYPKRCHTYAFNRIARSQYSVRDFAAACLHERAIRIVPVAAAEAACFANCNTPGDLPIPAAGRA